MSGVCRRPSIAFPISGIVFGFIIGTLMIPATVTFIPTYVIVARLKLVNTFAGLILPGVFSAFCAFMYRQFFLDFPSEIEEAGTIDGLGYLGKWARLAMPNSRSITIALALIGFFGSWNAFLWPLVVGIDSSKWTIQVIISVFITSQTVILHQIFLSALVALLPITTLFLIFQRSIQQGVSMSGVKG